MINCPVENQPQSRNSNQGVDDARNDSVCAAAENHSHQVEVKQADKQPNDSTDYHQRKSNNSSNLHFLPPKSSMSDF